MFARGVKRVSRDQLFRRHELRVHQTAGERGGHLARAEKTDF